MRKWLIENGFKPKVEHPLSGKVPDVLGYNGKIVQIAVELKLSDWKRALYQAIINTSSAKESYIAMPEKKSYLLKANQEEFTRWGVGILIVKDSGDVEIIHSAGQDR